MMNMLALHTISYGVYVVSSKLGERPNGQICNTVFQVTADPPVMAVSINRENFTHECLCELKAFTVSALSTDADLKLIGRFGFRCGRDFDKFDGVGSREGVTGAPILLDSTVSFVECEVIARHDLGTHSLFLGRVVECDMLDPETEPMTYRHYHEVVKGKSPRKAPTYIAAD